MRINKLKIKIMSTSKLFEKHFGNTASVDLKHPNIESFFEELNDECLAEDKNKNCNISVVGSGTCKKHKPMNKVISYVEWQEWAYLKIRRGHMQMQCDKCGYWYFKCEI